MDPLCLHRRRAPSIEALEPRLLFSGDAAGAAVGEAVAWAAAASAPASDAAVVWTAPAESGAARQAGAPRELAVVDTRVPDVGRLLADLEAQRVAGRPIDVVVLGSGEDALQALDAELAAADVPYRAVHFFGHGTAGSMQMGGTALDLATVRANADAIAGWSAGLTGDADLLLWGCDTGAGAEGAALLDALAGLTGADVAASEDATGGLAHGGDWTLEVARGAIEAQAPIGAVLQADFGGVLAAEAPASPDAVVVPADSGGRQLAGNATGSVAVWVEANTNTVVAQRYDAAGERIGSLITVSSGAGRAAAVAMDADGGDFVVVWQDGTGSSGQILAQRYSANGATVDVVPLAVTADAVDLPSQPAVAMNANGDAVIVWAQEMGNGGGRSVDLVYRRMSASGVFTTPIETLIRPSEQSGTQSHPSVAMQADGGFAVAYLDASDGGSIRVIAVPDSDDPANGVSSERLSTLGDVAVDAPSIAALADGRYAVAWSSAATGGDATVRAVLVDGETGEPATAFQVSDAAIGVAAARPSIAVAPGNILIVVWQQDDGVDGDLRGRVFNAGGSAIGASFEVNRNTTGVQQAASIAVVNGVLQVAWTGPAYDSPSVNQTWLRTITQDDSGGRQLAANGVAGSGSVAVWIDALTNTVVAQRHDDAGAAVGARITVSAGTGRTPAVAMDADGGGFIVVWQDGVGESGQILAQRYLANGDPDGAVLAVTADAADRPSQPAVAMDANGDAVVVWAQDVTDLGGNRSVDLVYRRISATGGLAATIHTLTHTSEQAGVQSHPSVALQADGGFAVAFVDAADGGSIRVIAVPDSSDSATGVQSQRLSPAGHVAVNAPSIAALADGRYAVAWSSAAAGAVATVQAVVVDGETGLPGTAFQVSDAPLGVAAGRPSISVAPGNALVVVWQQADGGDIALRGRMFTLAGAPYDPSFSIDPVVPGTQQHASVAVVDGALQILWSSASGPLSQTFLRTIAGTVAVTWPTSAVTSEADGSTGGATVQVRLTLPPTGTVTVRVTVINSRAGADEATVHDGVLTFTSSNWNLPQTVTIRGNDEARPLDDGDQSYTVRVAVDTSLTTTAAWQAVADQDKPFQNLDNDTYSEFVVTTDLDVDDVARAPGDPLTPFDLWLHQQNGNTVSLREALLAANFQAEAPGSRDRIRFDLPPGSSRIVLDAMLPTIDHAVDIDGGAPSTPNGALNVELTRTNAAGGGNGLVLGLGSDGSRIANLAIGGFGANGVLVQSSDNVIENNHIGVDASGTGALANGQRGVSLWSENPAATIARNVIANNVIGANGQGGIRILGGNAYENVVQGNFIGTDRSSELDLGNGQFPDVDPFGYGILLTNGTTDNLIGGPDAGQGNVLRNNGDFGILVVAASSRDNTLLRNHIDADVAPIERDTGTRTVPTPVLSNARPGNNAGTTTQVAVTLSGTAFAYYRLDFYVDRAAFEPGSVVTVDAQTWISGVSHRVVQLGSNGRWSGTVTLSTQADYTMAVVATATATDAAVPTPDFGETSALSNASRVNLVPVFQATSNLSVAENTNPAVTSGPYAVATLSANDPDLANGPLIWSIVGGDDRADFSIDRNTGALRFNFPPDYENPQDANATHPTFHNTYEVVVRAVDVLGGQSDRRYVVTVLNQNERPTLALPPTAVQAVEDTDLAFRNATAVSVGDPDRVSSMRRVVVELSVDRGTLGLGGDLDDVSFRDGTNRVGSRIVISGDLEDIQDALARIGYRPAADDFGTARLTVTVSDRDDPTLSSSGSVEIAIAAVNDAPVVGTVPPDAPINLRATGSLALDTSLLATADVDHAPEQLVYMMTARPAAGQLLRDGVEIGVGGTFTQADVNAGRMRFLAPTQGGLQQLSLEVHDGANAAATYGPIVLKLSVQSLAAASSASSASGSASAAASGAGGTASGAGDAPADSGSGGGDSGGTAARSAAGTGAQAAAARAGGASAAGGPAVVATPGATTQAGAIATQTGGAELRSARQDAPSAARDPAGGMAHGNLGAAALATALSNGHDASDRIRGATATSASVALTDAWRRAGALQAAEAAAEIQQAWSPVVALRQADFREELAQSREEATSKFQASSALVASSVAISTSLSLGYAIWLLRGGVLLTSLLASMPAWRSIDPLPVLARIDARGQDDDDEDDSLRGMLQRAADEQAERVAEAEADAVAQRLGVPAGRIAEGVA